ncbi:MAG: membrane protein [Thermomicrobiales bacterium]|nr:MAG: membrane protein [Thermomicrobiales bacterium]
MVDRMKRVQATERIPIFPGSGNWVRTVSEHGQKAKAGHRWRWRRPLGSEAWRWALTAVLFTMMASVSLALSLLLAIFWQARVNQAQPADAIVVLGAAQYDGQPSPVLQARLDTALLVYQRGLAPVIIVTGGRQAGDRFTEAESGRAYLVDHGVPSSAVLLENQGRSSWESMRGVAEILDREGLHRVLLVSDGFHLFRLKVMARELGITAYAVPAQRSPIRQGSSLELSYIVREAGGVVAFLAGAGRS